MKTRSGAKGGDLRQNISRRGVLKGLGIGAAGSVFATPYLALGQESKPLSFWLIGDGAASPWANLVKAFVDRWNAGNKQQIAINWVPGASEEYYVKAATAFAAGDGPDLFMLSPSDFLRYGDELLFDMTPLMTEAQKADFYPDVMTTRMVNGKIYGIPTEVEPMAFYYRVDSFERAGLNENDVPQTWEQLLAIGKKLTTPDQYGLLFQTKPGGNQIFTWTPFMWQGGGDYVGKDGKTAFNSPAAIQALQFWQDAIQQGSAPRQIMGGGFWDITANLGAGFCAIQNMGVWGIGAMQRDNPSVKYGVFELPAPPNGNHTSIAGGWAWVASNRGKNPEAASRFILESLAAQDDAGIQRMYDWNVKVKTNLPARKSVVSFAKSKGDYQDAPSKLFVERVLPHARGEPRLPPQIAQYATDAIQAAQLNGEAPASVAARTAEQIEKFLATYKGPQIL